MSLVELGPNGDPAEDPEDREEFLRYTYEIAKAWDDAHREEAERNSISYLERTGVIISPTAPNQRWLNPDTGFYHSADAVRQQALALAGRTAISFSEIVEPHE